jgi:hypothetical protein
VLLAAVVVLAAAPSLAVSFQVTGWDLGETVDVTFNGQTQSFATAHFREVVDGVAGTSFCTDLVQHINVGTYSGFVAYDPASAGGPLFGSPPRSFELAAKIVNQWSDNLGLLTAQLPGVTELQAITGVQVAVWEAAYGASFTATSASMSAGAYQVFQHVLGFDYSSVGYGNTLLYYSDRYQDQLFTPPVPEPSAMLVFAAGALLVGGSLLRRSRAA